MPLKTRFEELELTKRLPTPPGVAVQLLRLGGKEDVSPDEIVTIVQADPVIAGKLLRNANSAALGGVGTITTLASAVLRLGVRRAMSTALGFSLLGSSREGAAHVFDFDRFWAESLARALAAEFLAPGFSTEKPVAFLGGLLMRIGQLALAFVHSERYDEYLQRRREEPTAREVLQLEIFGVRETEAASALLGEWQVPELYVNAICPPRDDEPRDFARLLPHAQDLGLEIVREQLADPEDLARRLPAGRDPAEVHAGLRGAWLVWLQTARLKYHP